MRLSNLLQTRPAGLQLTVCLLAFSSFASALPAEVIQPEEEASASNSRQVLQAEINNNHGQEEANPAPRYFPQSYNYLQKLDQGKYDISFEFLPRRDRVVSNSLTGEDNFFVSEELPLGSMAVGITSGGFAPWLHANEDSSSLSRELCHQGKVIYEQSKKKVKMSPVSLLKKAYKAVVQDKNVRDGSVSALFAVFSPNKVVISNLGDSSAWLFRDGEVVDRATKRMHAYNIPFQLTKKTDEEGVISEAPADRPKESRVYEWKVKKGDTVVFTTAGVHKFVERRTFYEIARQQLQNPTSLTSFVIQVIEAVRKNPDHDRSANRDSTILAVHIQE